MLECAVDVVESLELKLRLNQRIITHNNMGHALDQAYAQQHGTVQAIESRLAYTDDKYQDVAICHSLLISCWR